MYSGRGSFCGGDAGGIEQRPEGLAGAPSALLQVTGHGYSTGSQGLDGPPSLSPVWTLQGEALQPSGGHTVELQPSLYF